MENCSFSTAEEQVKLKMFLKHTAQSLSSNVPVLFRSHNSAKGLVCHLLPSHPPFQCFLSHMQSLFGCGNVLDLDTFFLALASDAGISTVVMYGIEVGYTYLF